MTGITIIITHSALDLSGFGAFPPGNAIARTTGEGSIGLFQDQAASFLLGTLHQPERIWVWTATVWFGLLVYLQ